MKLILTITVSLIVISCSSLHQPRNEILDSEVGWMHGNCLVIKNSNISSQEHFTLVHLDDKKTIEKALIIKKAKNGEECYPLLGDRIDINKNSGYSFYIVKSKKTINLAIGVFKPENVSGLDFSSCNTTEGIQFSLSKKGRVIWQGYYYLGYESEPTCR